MRTADSYIEQYAKLRETKNLADSIIEIVNTARREALEEAADKIIIDGNPANAKQFILNMAKELK